MTHVESRAGPKQAGLELLFMSAFTQKMCMFGLALVHKIFAYRVSLLDGKGCNIYVNHNDDTMIEDRLGYARDV